MDDQRESELYAIAEQSKEIGRQLSRREHDEEEAPRKPRKNYADFIVDIQGKKYMTVAGRIRMFWDQVEEFNQKYDLQPPEASITTEVTLNGDRYQVKATVRYGSTVASGHASEVIGDGMVNRDSALENAESSAVGRALGNFGIGLIGSGGVASAEEVQRAQERQSYTPSTSKPISPKQKEMLLGLCLEKGVKTTEAEVDAMTSKEASARIEALLKMPKKASKSSQLASNEDIVDYDLYN